MWMSGDHRVRREAEQDPLHDSPHRAGGHHNRRMTDVLARIGLRRMTSRDTDEPHRVATPLELLFDLVFVVAVSQASQNLHHLISDDHVGQGVLSYLMVFFAIWWAWMNFTWFASAFDTDDWLYRVMTIVQMAGVLVLAAGVHAAMVDFDFLVVTWGYVIMRLAMVGQWLRAAASDPDSRPTALRFAIGIGIVQLLWLAPHVPARRAVAVLDLLRARRGRARRAGVGGVAPAHELASAPHRRALRTVHAAAARREPARIGQRDDRRARRGRAHSRAARARRVRTGRDRGHLVAVLRARAARTARRVCARASRSATCTT